MAEQVRFPFDQEILYNKYRKMRILPKNDFEKQAILLKVIELFEDRKYEEEEVNSTIKPLFDDYVLVRRELINFSYMGRDSSKGIYWVTKRTLSFEDVRKNTILARHAKPFGVV